MAFGLVIASLLSVLCVPSIALADEVDDALLGGTETQENVPAVVVEATDDSTGDAVIDATEPVFSDAGVQNDVDTNTDVVDEAPQAADPNTVDTGASADDATTGEQQAAAAPDQTAAAPDQTVETPVAQDLGTMETPAPAEPASDETDSPVVDAPPVEASAEQAVTEASPKEVATTAPKEQAKTAAPAKGNTKSNTGSLKSAEKTVADPIKVGDAYVIESGAKGNETRVVSTKGNKKADGTNIETLTYKDVAGQKFVFVRATKTIKLTVTNEDGTKTTQSIDEFDIDADGNPFYWIKLAGTNRVLAVRSSKNVKGTNVILYKITGTDGQKWRLENTGAGLFKIISKLVTKGGAELVLDIKGGQKADGANLQIYTSNDSEAQRFALLEAEPKVPKSTAKLANGVYTIAARKNDDFVVDIKGASTAQGANVQLYKSNGTDAQRMIITSMGNGYYTIGVLGTAKVLSSSSLSIIPGANVEQRTFTGKARQQWSIQERTKGVYTFVNRKTGQVLDIAGGSMKKGTNIQTYRDMGKGSAARAQQFTLVHKKKDDTNFLRVGDSVTKTGIYVISPFANRGFALDVKGASHKSGAKIQLYAANGSMAQLFQLELVGKNQYRIRTAASGDYVTDMGKKKQVLQKGVTVWEVFWDKSGFYALRDVDTGLVLEIKGGKYANKTAVQANASTGSMAQHLSFEKAQLIGEGLYYLKSRYPGRTLEIKGARKNAGDYVQTYALNKSDAQKFKVVKVGNYYQIVNLNSGLALTGGGSKDKAGDPNILQKIPTKKDKKQLWKAVVGNDGYIELINVASGRNLFSSYGSKSANVVERDFSKKSITNSMRARSWNLVAASGWYRSNGHWYYASAYKYAKFEDDIDPSGKSLGNYDTLHDIWLRVNGYTSGSMKSYASKTKYLVCTMWDTCYVGVFVGKPYASVKDNWEPLFGWNCGNGNKNVIAQDAQEQAALEGRTTNWQWSPGWDHNLALGNTPSARAKLDPAKFSWFKKLNNTNHYQGPVVPSNTGERWFTSVRLTLGFHSTITRNPAKELGRHISHGCIRLQVNNAHTLYGLMAPKGTKTTVNGVTYDGVGPGSRCLQITA